MVDRVRNINEADPGDNALFAQWQDKLHEAIKKMELCSDRDGVLIEVAAQHPLIGGITPNAEFRSRLDASIDLFRQLKTEQRGEVRIYVPGSIHMFNGEQDKISLSEAGTRYLNEHGIDNTCLHGDDANKAYKGEEGVYNSSDECFVASRLFEELQFGELHSICSPAQLLRKALSYISFGYIPTMHSVPVDDMFHSYVDEAFLFIPRLLEDGNGLQGSSEEGSRLRKIRKPE